MGWKDRWDVLQWMNIANEIFGDSTQMVVHVISMGGATTMMVSGEEQKPFVRCFVEDCGYFQHMFLDIFRELFQPGKLTKDGA